MQQTTNYKMKTRHLALIPLICATAISSPISNEIVTEPLKNEEPAPPVLTPNQSLKTIQVPQEFKLELVAAEPLINDPVAIAWDEDGNLWVVEMWNYLSESNTPAGRIMILKDTNQDGQMDKSIVYLDKLKMPQAISFVKGGVLVADPPNLYYCQDKNEDNICDVKTTIGAYATKGENWNAENGLLHGIDNWIYSANSQSRMRFDGDTLSRNQYLNNGHWGITADSYGRLYYTKGSDWLHCDYFPWKESNRNPNYKSTAGLSENIVPSNEVFPLPSTPDGQNKASTLISAQGPTIYRGHTYPNEYKENAFVCAPSHNSIAYFKLSANNDTIEVTGEQVFQQTPDGKKASFIGSTDQRFRPVNTSIGPDGNLYIVDMYRNRFGPATDGSQITSKSGLGRIYRMVHKASEAPPFKAPQMSKMDSADLVAYLDHPNGWWRDTAQRIIVERQANTKATINKLNQLLDNGSEIGKIHALWTLNSLASTEYRAFEISQKDPSPAVRIHGLRSGKKQLSSLSSKDHQYVSQALKSPNEALRLQAVQSLLNLKDKSYVTTAIKNLSADDLAKPHFQEAIVSTLAQAESDFIHQLDNAVFVNKNEYMPLIEKLTKAIVKKREPDDLNRLKAEFSNEWIDIGIVAGLNAYSSELTPESVPTQTSISSQKNLLIDAYLRANLAKNSAAEAAK